MNRHEIALQTKVEHDLLRQVMEGVRISTGWQVAGADASRKLSTLRFITGSFQRHLERLLALEEYDGYMDVVSNRSAKLGRMTATLRSEHDTLRGEVRRVVQSLERLPATDLTALDRTCDELLALVGRVETHNTKEIDLLQEAFGQEEGGGEG
ncbi:MAG: hemerythrin domain-containing protein [Gemmataceae bacterium]